MFPSKPLGRIIYLFIYLFIYFNGLWSSPDNVFDCAEYLECNSVWCVLINNHVVNSVCKKVQVLTGCLYYSQTGCSFLGNFANFRPDIGILIDNLLGANCNCHEQLARFSLQISLCTFLGRLLLKSENWACTTKKITKAAPLGTSEVSCCNNADARVILWTKWQEWSFKVAHVGQYSCKFICVDFSSNSY